MFCKNRITLIGRLGKDAETRFTEKGTAYSRFPVATNVSWKDKQSGEYQTRTEWHACVVWTSLAAWAAALKKGAFVEIEGELRYREFQPKGTDLKVRAAKIHVTSNLTLDRAERYPTPTRPSPVNRQTTTRLRSKTGLRVSTHKWTPCPPHRPIAAPASRPFEAVRPVNFTPHQTRGR
jgi:single-strand DNA-binding protein